MKDAQKRPVGDQIAPDQATPAQPTAPPSPLPIPVTVSPPTDDSGMDVDDAPLARLSPARGGQPVVTRPDRFVYPTANYRDPKDQVKYGPGEGLSSDDQALAYAKIYGQAPPTSPDEADDKTRPLLKKRPGQAKDKQSVIFERLSQYDSSHGAYLEHAHRSGRPLTIQEQEAQETGDNAKDASINHVIASGVGQNTLNQALANFSRGESSAPKPEDLDGVLDAEGGKKKLAKSFAQQAAAVGRVQMYNRAITAENHQVADPAEADPKQVTDARGALLKDTVKLMEEGGLDRYKALLKGTFDSPGNLRVGHDGVNGVVSTGLDVELTPQGLPTPRSQRLQEAHLAAAPDHDTDIWTTFTDDDDVPMADRGAALSSSQEAPNPQMTDVYLPPEPAPAPSFVKRPAQARSGKQAATSRKSIKADGKIDGPAKTRKRADQAVDRGRKRREQGKAARRGTSMDD